MNLPRAVAIQSLCPTVEFTTEDNKIMPEFHSVDWKKKLQVISKYKDE